jgi:hypothetical protein
MEDLEKQLPAAEASVASEESQKNTKKKVCLNCAAGLTGKYCAVCGQRDLPKRQTLGELLTNFISSFWSYEGKFFLTTKYLITRPGLLAVEYTEGKRERYYHPARMYVFISFVFFLLFSLMVDTDPEKELTMDEDDIKSMKAQFESPGLDSLLAALPVNPEDSSERIMPRHTFDSINLVSTKKTRKRSGIYLTDADYKSVKSYDSAQALLPEEKRDNWFERTVNIRSIELNKQYENKEHDFGNDFGRMFIENISKVVFILLPVFALLLKLLYVRRDFYYSEHLVFTIYYYNFFYLAGSVQILLGKVPWLDWLSTIIGLGIFLYLLLAMKRMYKQRWGKTIVKFMLFGLLFIISIAIAFTLNAFWILMFI